MVAIQQLAAPPPGTLSGLAAKMMILNSLSESTGPWPGSASPLRLNRSGGVTHGKIKVSLVDWRNNYDYSICSCKVVVMRVIVSHADSFEARYIPKRLLRNNELNTHVVVGNGCRSHSLWERNGGLL